MLEDAGLDVVAETAILFIPGWLRMLDLACHSWCRPFAAVTGSLVRPFVFLDRHVLNPRPIVMPTSERASAILSAACFC